MTKHFANSKELIDVIDKIINGRDDLILVKDKIIDALNETLLKWNGFEMIPFLGIIFPICGFQNYYTFQIVLDRNQFHELKHWSIEVSCFGGTYRTTPTFIRLDYA